MTDTFKTRSTLTVSGQSYQIFNLAALGARAHGAAPVLAEDTAGKSAAL